ncbi:MAG: hypothetical protein [Bacteriophage sp.]|nr:MAG: hypothetical protein [Bacteriophage sp.]
MRKYKHITLELALELFERYGYSVLCDADSLRISPEFE